MLCDICATSDMQHPVHNFRYRVLVHMNIDKRLFEKKQSYFLFLFYRQSRRRYARTRGIGI